MAKFKYRALTSTNERVEGEYEARNKEEVMTLLVSHNYYPLKVEEVIESTEINIGLPKKVKLRDISIFCRQFYTMLDAGVKLDDCLDILNSQMTHVTFKQALQDITERIKKGEGLADSMQLHESVFPDLLIKMVKSGEISGNLDTIMLRMSMYYEKENKTNSKVRNAMIYPIILAVVAVGAVTMILTFVMPTFIEMFEQNNVELPALTRLLIWASDQLTTNWLPIIMGITLLVFCYRFYAKTEHGKYTSGILRLRLPILKPLNEKIIVSRFTRTLSTLLGSGIPLASSIHIVSEVVGNRVAELALHEVRERLLTGDGLADPIKETQIFPPMLASMVKIGEESGALDDILNKTADFYEDELEAQIAATTALVEPLLIVVMGIVIGVIALAIMLPMFEMYTQI